MSTQPVLATVFGGLGGSVSDNTTMLNSQLLSSNSIFMLLQDEGSIILNIAIILPWLAKTKDKIIQFRLYYLMYHLFN